MTSPFKVVTSILGLWILGLGCGAGKSPTSPSEPTNMPTTPGSNSSSPFAGAKLYTDPNSAAAAWVNTHRTDQPTRADLIAQKIVSQPQAFWLGEWSGNVGSTVGAILAAARARGEVPVFVAYNIPNRDCAGTHSAGGIAASAYPAWISSLASGLAGANAPLILEPDALIHLDCLSTFEQEERLNLLKAAVQAIPNASSLCYLDAGHQATGIPANTIADLLIKAGVAQARGFALNVSNFRETSECIGYGNQIIAALESRGVPNKHFVIDTSRNGRGPQGTEWCNPPGRALGRSTTSGSQGADAQIWIKRPGESDGPCNGGPNAGQFWPEYAEELAKNSS